MRRLLFDPHIKLALVSGFYTLFLLLTIPRIPVRLNYGPVNIDSYLGGYVFNVFGKTFDFSTFNKSTEFGGGYRLTFTMPSDQQVRSREVLVNRLNALNIQEYNVVPYDDGEQAVLEVNIPYTDKPEEVDAYLQQRGYLIFRELSEEIEWNEENASEYFYDTSYWKDTALDSNQILGITFLSESADSSQFQVNLTPEGQQLFSELVDRNIGRPLGLYLDDSSFPISMPLIGKDMTGVLAINPVVASNIEPEATRVFTKLVNTGAFSSEYAFAGKEEISPLYTGFSARLFALASIVGFSAASLFVFFTYKKFSIAFLFSLFVQFVTMLFLLKVTSVYIGLRTILIISLSTSLYFAFGVLLLSQMKENSKSSSFFSIHMRDAFKTTLTIVKPYFLVAVLGIIMFYFVYDTGRSGLLRDVVYGCISSYIGFLIFKLFAGLFWVRKGK